MTKHDLVSAMAEKTGNTKKDTAVQLDAVLECITEALKKGEKIQLVGFGSFYVTETAERQGRNPATGKSITIAAAKHPKFKAGKAFKEMVNA